MVQIIRTVLSSFGLSPKLGVLYQHAPFPLRAERLPKMDALPCPPKISIITPSFNQSQFIDKTIQSVLDQRYGNLEYIVVDGASTDGTVPKIKRIQSSLSCWISEPDGGQAEAINKGFRFSSGEIMGYLNSDDLLLPGALNTIATIFRQYPSVDVIYGHRILIDENGLAIGRWVLPPHSRSAYAWGDFIPQETIFWRRHLWEKVGGVLDESFQFAMDWELLTRFENVGARFFRIPRFIGAFRVHDAQKTSLNMETTGRRESELVLSKLHHRKINRLEKCIRLAPYLISHIFHDRRSRKLYQKLTQPLESNMSLGNDKPTFGMHATLVGLRSRGYVPDVVFDVGAADGSWTREAIQIWPSSQYVCFEPLVERRKALDNLVAEFPGRISVQACGVGDADCELSLGVTDFLWDSSFAYGGSSERRVTVRKLDSLFSEGAFNRPSFVKIDVQGFEKRVIEGGSSVLSQSDFILMECTFIAFCEEMRTLDKTIAFMSEQGFIPYEFVDFLRRPLDGAMGQCDILFVRKGHPIVEDNRWAK